MEAVHLHAEKLVFADGAIREDVIWRVPVPVPPSQHAYKYRLVDVVAGQRVLGFDNERGKGDHHHHHHGAEVPYPVRGLAALLRDFRGAVSKEGGE